MEKPDLTTVDIRFLKGIGEKRAISFNRLGIFTIDDLLHFFPRTYQDFSTTTPIMSTILGDTCCIKAMITKGCTINYVRRGMTLYKFVASDDTAAITITFFNNRFVKDMIQEGKTYYFYGKISGNGYRREMVSPEFENGETVPSLRPIYHTTQNLTSRQIAAAERKVFEILLKNSDDPLPDRLREKYNLCHVDFALENIHFPKDKSLLESARRRLVFEELLTLSLGMSLLKSHNDSIDAPICKQSDFSEFYSALGFTPTGAQMRAVSECASDMERQQPMNRLLEGDVGSGKTCVAAALCWHAAKNSLQSAFMAPTEILAKQHFDNLSSLLSKSGVVVELLTGSTTTAEKRRIKEELKSGKINVIIGTHALLTEGVDFQNLGLVITDEQHRFGVGQRAALVAKGKDPHVLVMSATPIPRTLGLIIYGDLDISILDEMPKGRQKIETFCVDSSKHQRIYKFLKKHVAEGHQAYIVCPLVDESDGEGTENLTAATQYFEKLQKGEFRGYRLGLLHGKMKPAEKESVMRAFSQGEIDILISTTVIEVGVDVPNAVDMVVENAERFGLSQLHQLRGRVGRGTFKSYCILISDTRSPLTVKRLRTMCETSDGFKIAEQDLTLRGPGDFFGSRQHGLPELRIADVVSDMDLLRETQKAAKEILEDDKNLSKAKNKGLKTLVRGMFSKENVVFN